MVLPTLFERAQSQPLNIIPHGGEAIYHGIVFDEAFCDRLLEKLLKFVPWKNDEGIMYDKSYVTNRKIAWYSPKRTWPPELFEMKERVESITGTRYTHVLLNLYESGDVGLGLHRDKESWEEDSSIASVSLGAERRFVFEHMVTKKKVSIILEHGSLLEMKGMLQNFWKHGLPKSKKVCHPRINLTFRK